MDNTAKGFAQKIVSELESIKRLIIDAVSLPHQETSGADRHKDKSNDAETDSDTKIPPRFKSSETHPAVAENKTTNNKSNGRREWFKEHGVEVAGVVIVAAYTTVAIFQWCASREANRISREIGQKQIRAYLGAEPTLIENLKEGFTTSITFKIDNFGQTPARSVRSHTHAEVLPSGRPFPFDAPSGTTFESVASIYPHLPIPTGVQMDHPLSADNISAIVYGKAQRLYAGGIIQYEDVVGMNHCLRFFFSIGGPELISSLRDWEAGKRNGISAWRSSRQYNDEDRCDAK
jgi:hypothetical protein